MGEELGSFVILVVSCIWVRSVVAPEITRYGYPSRATPLRRPATAGETKAVFTQPEASVAEAA
jgi:hypothetical protein